MLNSVYTVFDRYRRPLRNHIYLVFPEYNIAYARVSEPAFELMRPVLGHLADVELGRPGQRSGKDPHCPSDTLFNGNVELLTARELKRRHPNMPVVAFVQNPADRLAFGYERLIRSDAPLPCYFRENRFTKTMSVEAFAWRAATISDLQADNMLRSQTAALTYKGALVPDRIFRIEDISRHAQEFLSLCGLDQELDLAQTQASMTPPKASDLFAHPDMASLIRRRYRNDFTLFYSGDTYALPGGKGYLATSAASSSGYSAQRH